ncbi:MAG: efflux RND transporter periplasmic adaptor subunit, partial [Bryobacteraceae bacterium]
MKKLFILALVAVAVWAAWKYAGRSDPASVSFARVQRETLVSTLPTNGKVEPVEWRAVHAEIAGVIERVAVEE